MSISEHQAHYDMMNTGCWAVRDAKECPCHGHGYALSEVDTWGGCRSGLPYGTCDEEDYEAWKRVYVRNGMNPEDF